jgi:hypothetical protein
MIGDQGGIVLLQVLDGPGAERMSLILRKDLNGKDGQCLFVACGAQLADPGVSVFDI